MALWIQPSDTVQWSGSSLLCSSICTTVFLWAPVRWVFLTSKGKQSKIRRGRVSLCSNRDFKKFLVLIYVRRTLSSLIFLSFFMYSSHKCLSLVRDVNSCALKDNWEKVHNILHLIFVQNSVYHFSFADILRQFFSRGRTKFLNMVPLWRPLRWWSLLQLCWDTNIAHHHPGKGSHSKSCRPEIICPVVNKFCCNENRLDRLCIFQLILKIWQANM